MPKMRRKPPNTQEAREQQCISMAIDLAEKQLSDGTAKPSVIVHFLKLGSSLAELERAKLEAESELVRAKATQLRSTDELEKKFDDAMNAFKSYGGEILDEDQDYQ